LAIGILVRKSHSIWENYYFILLGEIGK